MTVPVRLGAPTVTCVSFVSLERSGLHPALSILQNPTLDPKKWELSSEGSGPNLLEINGLLMGRQIATDEPPMYICIWRKELEK